MRSFSFLYIQVCFHLSSQSYNCYHVFPFVSPWPWDAKVNYSLAVQVQLDDNYTTAGGRGGKQILSVWACMELIRWFSSRSLFFPWQGGGGQGRTGKTLEGLACSARLRGKRLWGKRAARVAEGGGALSWSIGPCWSACERSGRSRYCHTNNKISFVATLIPSCPFKLSLSAITMIPYCYSIFSPDRKWML